VTSILAAHPYAPILVLLLVVIGMVVVIMVLTHLIGPKRYGTVKQDTYEAGMPIIGDARRRFNVKFYLVAMMFLLFDVEIIFLWPWVLVFFDTAMGRDPIAAQMTSAGTGAGFLLVAMAIFFAILVVGYVYDWSKGIFRWS
jgi:NADH-quinone oxidoreductase subunit A